MPHQIYSHSHFSQVLHTLEIRAVSLNPEYSPPGQSFRLVSTNIGLLQYRPGFLALYIMDVCMNLYISMHDIICLAGVLTGGLALDSVSRKISFVASFGRQNGSSC